MLFSHYPNVKIALHLQDRMFSCLATSVGSQIVRMRKAISTIRFSSDMYSLAQWISSLKKKPNLKFVVIEIGAGHAVPTVRRTSENYCKQLNGTLIRINLRDYDVPSSAYRKYDQCTMHGLINIFCEANAIALASQKMLINPCISSSSCARHYGIPMGGKDALVMLDEMISKIG